MPSSTNDHSPDYSLKVQILMADDIKRGFRHEIDNRQSSTKRFWRNNAQHVCEMKEICKYIAKGDQSLVDVRGERRGSSAECSTEEATEGRRSSVSGRSGGRGEDAVIERFDERLEGGSGGPPDFQREPARSVTPPRLRPRAVGSRTIIPTSTPNFGGDVSWRVCPRSSTSRFPSP
jgi:hypothetical protein